jgi:hypothetical protein
MKMMETEAVEEENRDKVKEFRRQFAGGCQTKKENFGPAGKRIARKSKEIRPFLNGKIKVKFCA